MLLCVQVVTTRSAIGISARALLLDGIVVSLRLSSTLLYHGYLPNDKSGDSKGSALPADPKNSKIEKCQKVICQKIIDFEGF